MDDKPTSLNELIEFHKKQAEDCEGMSRAAYGCGDSLGGGSYALAAKWHWGRARHLTSLRELDETFIEDG